MVLTVLQNETLFIWPLRSVPRSLWVVTLNLNTTCGLVSTPGVLVESEVNMWEDFPALAECTFSSGGTLQGEVLREIKENQDFEVRILLASC